jgi:hypothetical protein
MPFDAEFPTRPVRTVDAGRCPITAAADPSPELAQVDPDRLLAYLYVAPRPCAALDALLGL